MTKVPQGMLGANVAGNGPAFSAYLNGTQSVTTGQYAKININTEDFDTDNAFDATTNYRFQPTVAGYYWITGAVATDGTNPTSAVAAIYKNGSQHKLGSYIQASSASSTVSCLVYLNGSTDYIELYGYQTADTAIWGGGATDNYLQGFLARAA